MTGFTRRPLCIVVVSACLLAAAGCQRLAEQEPAIWEQAKIADLAPVTEGGPPQARFHAAVHMDVHSLEMPAEDVDRLDTVWEVLTAKPMRMNSYNAFSENGFRVKFGRTENWLQIQSLLTEAGAQRTATTSLILAEKDVTDLPVAHLPEARRIAFVSSNLSQDIVNVGPGALVLRLTCEPMPWARGVRKIIAYPAYTLPVTSAIRELEIRVQKHDFPFASAAFATQMGPGDLLVLGPEKYSRERISLGGLFFNKPEGSLFFQPASRKPPRHKPAVRVFVLVCTNVRD